MASAIHIKSLRLRLGWTQSDLARRLGCEAGDIKNWESTMQTPPVQFTAGLERLAAQADECASELQSTPKAENACSKKALGQVRLFGLEDSDKN